MDTNQHAAVAIPQQPREGAGETVASTRRARFQIRVDPARRGRKRFTIRYVHVHAHRHRLVSG